MSDSEQIARQPLSGGGDFVPVITFFFSAIFFAVPHPLPTGQNLREMP